MKLKAIPIKIGCSVFALKIIVFFLVIICILMYPIMIAQQAVKIASEVGDFMERMGNLVTFRGWCTAEECYAQEEAAYYLRLTELNKKYSDAPYALSLDIPLIQATMFYGFNYKDLYNPDAEDFSKINENDNPSVGKYDYRAAKNQIQDLINHLVFQDKNGKYYQDREVYDEYLKGTYIPDYYNEMLVDHSIDEILNDIHELAEYYRSIWAEKLTVENDIITGTILDLIDAPFRDTECAITSPYTSKRGAKAHYAVDVIGKTNRNIYSVADGVVKAVVNFPQNLYSKWDPIKKICSCGGVSCANGYGTYIVVEHKINDEKYYSRYAHLNNVLVSVGQPVTKGQQIAVEGNTGCSTGAHLHFEFYDEKGHKFDPTPIMSRCSSQAATVATCDLNNIMVRLTECTAERASAASNVVEVVPFKEYVMGVFTKEISAGSYEMEFMKAFAIAVQTFSLNRGDYDPNSNYIYLRNCSSDQNYGAITAINADAQARVKEAVDAVFGKVLMKDGKLMGGYYKDQESSGCGYQLNDMCQKGGNELAQNGKTMEEILKYYYVEPSIVNFCDAKASESNPGVDNTKKELQCGMIDDQKKKEFNDQLNRKVVQAGYATRAGVVAAARYLAIDFPYKVPFYASEGNSGDYKGRYYADGLNLDVARGWGCPIKKEGNPTTEQMVGSAYPNGLDASGFISWALRNGGLPQTDLDGRGLLNLASETVPFADQTIDRVQVGDLCMYQGRLGIVVGVDVNNIYVAEELGVNSGLVVTTHPKNEDSHGDYYALLTYIYAQEGNITKMW